MLLSGGVSVGPHDHVKGALAELGVEERFWRVALRPGKPTWFGVARRDARVRAARQPGLGDGHLPAVRAAGARRAPGRRRPRRAAARVLGEPLTPNAAARRVRARAACATGARYATGPQGSHVLRSMTLADALAFVAARRGACSQAGDRGRADRDLTLRASAAALRSGAGAAAHQPPRRSPASLAAYAVASRAATRGSGADADRRGRDRAAARRHERSTPTAPAARSSTPTCRCRPRRSTRSGRRCTSSASRAPTGASSAAARSASCASSTRTTRATSCSCAGRSCCSPSSAPEYEMDDERGVVRWRIERGVLVAPPGIDADGYLEIDIRRRPARRARHGRPARRGRGRQLLPADRVRAHALGLRGHAVAHPRDRHVRLPALDREAEPRSVEGRPLRDAAARPEIERRPGPARAAAERARRATRDARRVPSATP